MTAKRSQLDPFLGRGLYTVSEAAAYARVSPQLMHRWLAEDGQGVIRKEIDDRRQHVSFVDFLQTLTVRRLRESTGLSLQTIRSGVQWLEEKGIVHPFARDHELSILENRHLAYRVPGGDLLIISDRDGQRNQHLIEPVVQEHLRRVTFGDDGLGIRYSIDPDRDLPIVMDARRNFGEPTTSSGYTARSLHDAVMAEGSIESAARACDVSVDEVARAFRFIDSLSIAHARRAA